MLSRPLAPPFPHPPQSGLITWDGVLDYVLAARDGSALRRLIDSHYLDHLLKAQETVDKARQGGVWDKLGLLGGAGGWARSCAGGISGGVRRVCS